MSYIEYDENKIIQLGSIILKRIGKELYQPCRSLNVYIKTKVCQFVQNYTNITQEFLDNYGVSLEEAKQDKLNNVVDGEYKEKIKKIDTDLLKGNSRLYEVEIWVNNVKHAKICTECHRKGECLKGVDMDCKKDDWKPCKPEKTCDPCKPREEKED